jgi:tetratricopeptide (TPR) repeat protein
LTGRTGITIALLAALMIFAAGAATQEISSASLTEEHLAAAEEAFGRAIELDTSDPEAASDYYRKAILHYERLVASGVRNGRLYYNIGNAWFRLDDMGRAILNYKRSDLYNPADPNLDQNLQFARSRRINRIEAQQRDRVFKTLFFIHYDVPTRVRFGIFLGAFILLWGAAIVAVFYRRGWVRTLIISLAVVSIIFLISLISEKVSMTRDPAGVVIAPEVTARKGDGETYQPSFTAPLYSGTEFDLLEQRPDWWYIELEDGARCWIPSWGGELVLQE